MMDEQTIRRISHQRRKDVYKVDALKLRKELADLDKQKDLNRFFKIVQNVLIAMMLITFVGIITVNENSETSVGEKTLQIFKERGWIE
jgi:hypothetical protein